MGEISDALRRARGERAAEAERRSPLGEPKPEASPPAVEAPVAPAPRTPAPIEPAGEVATIDRHRAGFWQARAVVMERAGAVAERFRHLAVRVRRELDASGSQTLLVASSLREEGKTVTSCNLALALASMASERRIALLDLDLRRPSVARAMGVRPKIGLEQVLRGEVSLASARIRTDVPALDLFLAASPMRHAHEVLATPALPKVLAELRQQYAIVVVDTPPVLLVPDVPLIVPHFDACLVVARVGKTARSAFQDMLGLLPRQKVLGGFLNEVRAAGHASQYGYYLGEDDEPDEDEDGDGDERAPRRRRRRRR
jgi:capsular exopolysaccharide synthesis family protein